MIRFGSVEAEVLEPGDAKHQDLVAKLDEVHKLLGPWIEDVINDDNEELIGYTMAVLLWVGTSLGFMKHQKIIAIDDNVLMLLVQNLKAGVEVGARRAARIEREYEAKHGKGETRQ